MHIFNVNPASKTLQHTYPGRVNIGLGPACISNILNKVFCKKKLDINENIGRY